MQLEVIRETFPGFYTEEVEVRKENREPFERIYFYDRSEGCENYGSVLTRHKKWQLDRDRHPRVFSRLDGVRKALRD